MFKSNHHEVVKEIILIRPKQIRKFFQVSSNCGP